MNLFETRVLHLLLTDPQRTWKKFVQNRSKLYQEVNDRVKAAMKYGQSLKGLPPGGDLELLNNYVAPLDIPESPKQLDEDKQLQVMEWASAPPEATE